MTKVAVYWGVVTQEDEVRAELANLVADGAREMVAMYNRLPCCGKLSTRVQKNLNSPCPFCPLKTTYILETCLNRK